MGRKFLPLAAKWLQPSAHEVNRDEVNCLPVDNKVKQAILRKRLPSSPPRLLHLDCPADALINFLSAPLPITPDRVAAVVRCENIFAIPSADTLARYFVQKQLCLQFLALILSLETSILTTDEMVGNLQPSDHKVRLTALTQWSIQTRLGTEAFFKEAFHRTILLHLQLRHESLRHQTSHTVYSKLMGLEPLICSTLFFFPSDTTPGLLDLYQN